MGIWGSIKDVGGWLHESITDPVGRMGKDWNNYQEWSEDPAETTRQDSLYGQADAAGAFADRAGGNYDALGGEANTERDYLRQVARGNESVSQRQLQESLQQNQAAQQSMAAGARPGNAAMAARGAAMNAGRQGQALAGQQATAGMQERQQAQRALQEAILRQRQQELQGATAGRGQAIGGYQAPVEGGSGSEQAMGLVSTGAGLISMISDERLKEDIEDGDFDADAALRALKSHSYQYKDQKHGSGKQLGIMAQELEANGLGQAVFETEDGDKAVHGAKLAGALAAMLPGINKRLEKLEE
jgi:hypothetical protein